MLALVGRAERRRLMWAAIALVLVAGVGLLDFLTPADVDFGEFYMVPVIIVAWYLGRGAGIAVAIVAEIVEFSVDVSLRSAVDANSTPIALWNGLATFVVLTALAVATDWIRRERLRYRVLDAERVMLLRALEQELPRPLRAIDWFARTFEDAVAATLTPALRSQFSLLRRNAQDAMFLATDLLAVGNLRLAGLRFERVPVSLNEVTAQAAEASPHRARIVVRAADDDLLVLADADRLRHALSSILARFGETAPNETVRVLIRVSGDDGVVGVSCRSPEIEERDLEFAELLVRGNGGRVVRVPGDSRRDSLVSVYVPRAGAGDVTSRPASEPSPRTAPRPRSGSGRTGRAPATPQARR